MLKRSSIRRITVTSVALLILGLVYFFPTTENTEDDKFIQDLIFTNNIRRTTIYLIDHNDYVAKSNIIITGEETEKIIEEIIEALTVNGRKQNYIPNGFKPIIPEDTKLLEHSLDENGLLKINFSKDLLEIKPELEERMIEAIVFSLTDLKDVKKIIIFVEGEQLTRLPHSKKIIPSTLDRSFGINKRYDLDRPRNSTKTTVYFISQFNGNKYYVPVTFVNNNTASKVEIIINELKTSPIRQTNLMSYLATNAELLTYEIKEDRIYMSFNKFLLDSFEDKKILEEVKYTIFLSLRANLNINEVIFNVEDEKVTAFSLDF